MYGYIKKCKSCGMDTYHHHELDDLCMDCEAAKYYTDSPEDLALAQSFKILAMAGHFNAEEDEVKQLKRIGQSLKQR